MDLVKHFLIRNVSRPVFRYWGDSDGGICNPSPPTHCRNRQRIPQNIELISIERCILGSARSSPSQFNLVFFWGKKETEQAEVSHSSASASHLYTIQWREQVTSPSSVSTQTSTSSSERDLVSEKHLGLHSIKMTEEAATTGAVSSPQLSSWRYIYTGFGTNHLINIY